MRFGEGKVRVCLVNKFRRADLKDRPVRHKTVGHTHISCKHVTVSELKLSAVCPTN